MGWLSVPRRASSILAALSTDAYRHEVIAVDVTATPPKHHERRSKRAVPMGFVLALNLLLAGTAWGVTEGDMAPEFVLPVLGGETTQSLSASHGKVRYVDFWASWCPPCRVSVPAIVALQRELGGDRFEVIAINVDERLEDAVRFMEHHPMNYVVLSDPSGATAGAWALPGMPTSFVVDAEGRVTLVHVGFRPGDMEAIRAHIVGLLERH